MLRKTQKLDPIILDEVSPNDEWTVERDKPCLPSDHEWLDEVIKENNYLDVIVFNNITPIQEGEDGNDPSTIKKQRVGVTKKFELLNSLNFRS